MASRASQGMSNRTRSWLIYAAAAVIMMLSAGAVLLPAAEGVPGSGMIGGLLLTAGIVEMLAGSLRDHVRKYAMAAGGVTALAGLMFLINPVVHFAPMVTLIIGWLLIRSLIILVASRHSGPTVCMWMRISAGLDFFLAVLLFAGLSISALIISIFGPTPPLIASFAWVLAASFVVTGSLLLEVASCERSLEQ